MPVSVLCRDHEYTATYSSIVNLQMRREEKKKGNAKKKKKKKSLKKCKFENGSADVHDKKKKKLIEKVTLCSSMW